MPLYPPPGPVLIPDGYAPLAADFTGWAINPLGFAATGICFRAQQQTPQSTGAPGAFTPMQYDTVLEDPFTGWSAANFWWVPPYDGWYEVLTGANIAATAGSPDIEAALLLSGVRTELAQVPTYSGNMGACSGQGWVYAAGGVDTIQGVIFSSATTTTDCSAASRYPWMEISLASQ
jgi:hypothetical protein